MASDGNLIFLVSINLNDQDFLYFPSCPEFSLGGADDEPASLDVQLEFLATQVSNEIKESEVIVASEGHVALVGGQHD